MQLPLEPQGMHEQADPSEPAHANASEIAPRSPAPSSSGSRDLGGFDESWLRDFYKECGREATLAYTTLNQMKNWAIVIQAAILAGVASMLRGTSNVAPDSTTFTPNLALFVGASLAFLFTLRFFVRGILCYVNLLRWNQLQSSIVKAFLAPGNSSTGSIPPPSKDRLDRLQRDIDNYYHGWKATVPRSHQLTANLKLGFGLLLTLPFPFLIWGAVQLWSNSFVQALGVFTVGGISIEVSDFLRSGYFDTPEVAERKRRPSSRPQDPPFPRPHHGYGYVMAWVLNLMIAMALAVRPLIRDLLCPCL